MDRGQTTCIKCKGSGTLPCSICRVRSHSPTKICLNRQYCSVVWYMQLLLALAQNPSGIGGMDVLTRAVMIGDIPRHIHSAVMAKC